MKIYFKKVTGYLWHWLAIMALAAAGLFSGYAEAQVYVPTQMVISSKVLNEIIMYRNYGDFTDCRNDRHFIIQLARKLGSPIWVTCTPLVNL